MAHSLWLTHLIFLCFYCLIGVVLVSMREDSCGRFFETRQNHVLVGHNISSVLVGDEFECQVKCIATKTCQSFNVHHATGKADNRVCELNNITRQIKPNDFKAMKASNYYGSIKVVCIDVSSEKKGKYTNSHYCHSGHKGKRCQAKTCTEEKNRNPKARSGYYIIDPDGPGGHAPFVVFCDMDVMGGVGATVVGHDSESKTQVTKTESPGSYVRNVTYLGEGLTNIPQLGRLADVSTHCEQFIEINCKGVRLLKEGYGWWVSRDGARMTYWGGAKPADRFKCACGVSIPNSCADRTYGCNCDKNDDVWRNDSGLLTEKSHLPVIQLRFGDTGDSGEEATYTLGKLKCYG